MINNTAIANNLTLGTKFKLFLKQAGAVFFLILKVTCRLAVFGILLAYFITPLAVLLSFVAPVLVSFFYTILACVTMFVLSIIFDLIAAKIKGLEIKNKSVQGQEKKENENENKKEIKIESKENNNENINENNIENEKKNKELKVKELPVPKSIGKNDNKPQVHIEKGNITKNKKYQTVSKRTIVRVTYKRLYQTNNEPEMNTNPTEKDTEWL